MCIYGLGPPLGSLFPLSLAPPSLVQELIEKVMCLQSTSSSTRPLDGDRVIANLLKYSQILAEQGKLSNALTYINATPQVSLVESVRYLIPGLWKSETSNANFRF